MLIQLGTGKGWEQQCADREGSKNCRCCGLGLLVQREGTEEMELQIVMSGLERGSLCLEVGVISRKTRGRVLQPPREPLDNCPKKQLLIDLLHTLQLALLGGRLCALGFRTVTNEAGQLRAMVV